MRVVLVSLLLAFGSLACTNDVAGEAASQPADSGPPNAPTDGMAADDDAGTTDAAPKTLAGRYQLQNVHSGKCVEIANDSRDDGALVVQRTCSQASAQAFDVVETDAGRFKIVDVFTGRALDVKDVSKADGALLQQWSYSGGQNQQFTLEKQPDGSYAILALHSGAALDVKDGSTADDAPVQQWAFHGAEQQKFRLIPYALPPEGFVRAQGVHFVDGTGNRLLLRGVSLGNWLVTEGYMWKFDGARGDRGRRIEARIEELVGADAAKAFWKSYRSTWITEDDIARIAQLGFDHVRLPMNARLLMPEGGDTFDEEQFGYIANVVAWSKKHGIRVVLDMHAAPGGETGKNIDDSADDYPNLFTNSANQDRLVKIWAELAKRYAKETTVLGYDLLNEPLPAEFSSLNPQLWKTYLKVAPAIRAVDTNHMLIVEGANWANDWSALSAPFDDNMAYSFHKYWNATDVSAIQGYLDKRAEWNRPVWVGESGENSDDWYRASFSTLEQHELSWCFWPWKKLESGNNPYSVSAPAGWDAIQAYVADASKKPSADAAKAALDGLIANIALAKSHYNESATCAVLPCR